jgi:hypothetical protein
MSKAQLLSYSMGAQEKSGRETQPCSAWLQLHGGSQPEEGINRCTNTSKFLYAFDVYRSHVREKDHFLLQ